MSNIFERGVTTNLNIVFTVVQQHSTLYSAVHYPERVENAQLRCTTFYCRTVTWIGRVLALISRAQHRRRRRRVSLVLRRSTAWEHLALWTEWYETKLARGYARNCVGRKSRLPPRVTGPAVARDFIVTGPRGARESVPLVSSASSVANLSIFLILHIVSFVRHTF